MTEPIDWDRVSAAYGLGTVLEVPAGPSSGLQGQVWRLVTSLGVWAVKETRTPIESAQAARAAEFSETARRNGVPAPVTRWTTEGRPLLRHLGRSMRIQGWVELADPTTAIDVAELGELVARLHRTALPARGPVHWWYTEPVGAATWDELVDAVEAARAPFAGRLAGLRDDLVALELVMAPMVPVQLCHLDLWADNVRRTAAGGLCVIDWDNCGPADPGRELALVLYEFARGDRGRLAALHGTYRATGGPGRVTAPADFAMLAAQLGHLGAMHLRTWLDPAASINERDRALAGIEEFLDDPLTPAVVAEILDALS